MVGTAGYGVFSVGSDGKMKEVAFDPSDQFFSRFFEDSRGRLWKSGFDDTIVMYDGKK
jgi:hypothetical protein